MSDIQELLKSLFKGSIEEMLEAEMDEHLGYEKHNPEGDLSAIVGMATTKRPSKARWAKQRLKYSEIERENLNPS